MVLFIALIFCFTILNAHANKCSVFFFHSLKYVVKQIGHSFLNFGFYFIETHRIWSNGKIQLSKCLTEILIFPTNSKQECIYLVDIKTT